MVWSRPHPVWPLVCRSVPVQGGELPISMAKPYISRQVGVIDGKDECMIDDCLQFHDMQNVTKKNQITQSGLNIFARGSIWIE